MKRNLTTVIAITLLIWMLVGGCRKEPVLKEAVPVLPEPPYNYLAEFSVTSKAGGNNSPSDNQLTNEGAALGRVLFYDSRLSVNNSISCASCHKQQFAFADNVAFSTGFGGKTTLRNSVAICNVVGKNSFFWDARAQTLEAQTLMPVRDHIEMGMERMDVLEKKLKNISYYPGLFTKAFGNEQITANRISKALAQFMRAMVSVNSRFDIPASSGLSPLQLEGQMIFNGKARCSGCHSDENLAANSINGSWGFGGAFANIGLDTVYKDEGIGAVNSSPINSGMFSIPSLRNIEYTAPYMHDGRFATLEEVIEHYNSGIQPHRNLDWHLRDFSSSTEVVPFKMNLTEHEKMALVAFLKSLTDNDFITDKRFSTPFK